MEKRFAAFLAITFLIIIGNALLTNMMNPPEPVDPDAVAELPDPAGEGKNQTDDGDKPATETDKPPAEDDGEPVAGSPPEPAEETEQNAGEDAESQEIEPTNAPEQIVALGSVNPDLEKNPYRLLATFTTRGAAVQRLELANPRYRDIHDRHGYLGHLSLVADSKLKGCRIRVVGKGTPAADAGLQVDDLITSAGEPSVAVTSPVDFAAVLDQTNPGDELSISVLRGGIAKKITVALIRRPLEVMRPEIENLRMRNQEPPEDFVDPPSLLLTLDQINAKSIAKEDDEIDGLSLHADNWEILEQSDDSIAFRYVVADPGIEVIKRYKLITVPEVDRKDPTFAAYHLEFDVEIRNLSETDHSISYRLHGPTGLPTEGWWYAHKIGRSWGGIGLRDWVFQAAGDSPQMVGAAAIAGDDVQDYGITDSFVYTGVDAQYFSAVLIPQKKDVANAWFIQKQGVCLGPKIEDDPLPQTANVTCRLRSQPTALTAGGPPLTHKYVFFAGPKVPELLVKYHQPEDTSYNLGELVYYGWFSPVARGMLGILHFFYGILANYGIAIICLTVLVRGCMFPLSRKQALNMAKMQELQPEMKRLQEKYKKDLQKRSQAQQELFRKNNYNPMGGCLLMFIQLPIFIGLYRGLMIDVELRDAPVFGHAIRWCSNLAAPDMLFDWSGFMPEFITSGIGILGLGPYLNVLPLVTVGLFIVQQKMFMPPPVDEQAALQQKVMHYMMIFMGLMFYKVASGLCIYFIASSLWGIAERKLLPKTIKSSTSLGSGGSTDGPNSGGDKPKLPKPGPNGNAGQRKKSTGNRKKKKQR